MTEIGFLNTKQSQNLTANNTPKLTPNQMRKILIRHASFYSPELTKANKENVNLAYNPCNLQINSTQVRKKTNNCFTKVYSLSTLKWYVILNLIHASYIASLRFSSPIITKFEFE